MTAGVRVEPSHLAIAARRPGEGPPGAEDRRRVRDANKPAHEIEEDIARTRARLSATVEALERELSPPRLIEKSVEMLRTSLEASPGPRREQVRAYAIPLALIATGLGWLFVLRRSANRGAGQTDAPSAKTVAPVEPVSLVDENTNA